MPPKKKVKEPEATQQAQPVPQNLFKIPKKPFYRSVQLDSDKRTKPIQIKLWMINSLKVKIWAEDSRQDSASLLTKQKEFSRAIAQLKQRALKNLRKFYFDSYQLGEVKINRLVSKSWRLEKVLFDCYDSYFSVKKYVKRSLNPHLKDFFLKMYRPHREIERLFGAWEYLVDCNVWFQRSVVFNTKNIQSFEKKNRVIENIEGISQNIPLNKDILDLSSMNASQLPNLKTLRVSYSVSDKMEQSHPTLDFIKNYPQLITLIISASFNDISSFNFLSSLPKLKQLTYTSEIAFTRRMLKTLPIINSLEKLKISCDPAQFSQENLQEFLAKNQNLKHLEVHFPLRDNYIIFQDNLILPLETLKLTATVPCQTNLKMTLKNLASFLDNHKHLKTLEIKLNQNLFLDLHEILLKGLTSMTCLEHLTWFCGIPNELQENKLRDLKKTLIQCSGIQKLELDVGRGFATSKDFSTVLDGLLRLKKLKYLVIRGSFRKITPAIMNKFLQFLRSLIFENGATVTVYLPEMPQEITQEIDRVIAQKNNLW